MGSSWARDWTCVHCIVRWILNPWTTRVVPGSLDMRFSLEGTLQKHSELFFSTEPTQEQWRYILNFYQKISLWLKTFTPTTALTSNCPLEEGKKVKAIRNGSKENSWSHHCFDNILNCDKALITAVSQFLASESGSYLLVWFETTPEQLMMPHVKLWKTFYLADILSL